MPKNSSTSPQNFATPLPAPHVLTLPRVKSSTGPLEPAFLAQLAAAFNLRAFVETGTYLGNTSAIASKIFPEVHTIELSTELAEQARARFAAMPQVHVYQGDSAELLPTILAQLSAPALFWLDGHYSEGVTARGRGNTPILDEIAAIARSGHKDAVILIDDLRLFERRSLAVDESSSLHGYPTVNELHAAVREIDPEYHFFVFGDVALAFHDAANVTVSPLVMALTFSRLFDGGNLPEEEVIATECLIAHATGVEREVLCELPAAFAATERHGLGLHYRLWYAQTLFGENKFIDGSLQLLEIRRLGFDHWRVRWYLAKAIHMAGYNSLACEILEELIKDVPDFAPARELRQAIPAPVLAPVPAPNPPTTSDRPLLVAGQNALTQLTAADVHRAGQALRLHLGCGEQHFDGYVNIDYPPSEHSCQTRIGADVFADITKLSFPPQSVDEIRLHHVFEHFDRVTALVLLCRWHHWLKQGGRLVIETPDMNASVALLLSDDYSHKQKQAVLRHVFGSNEASWAVHWDGWYEEKYRRVLDLMGFRDLEFETNQWQMTRNIVVRASKCRDLGPWELRGAAEAVLRDSLIDESKSEQRMLQEWMKKYDGLAQDSVMPCCDHQTALREFKAAAVQHSMGHVSSSLLLDVVIPVAAKDAETLPYVVESLRRNLKHPIGTIFVIGESDAKLQEVVREAGARFVDENGVLPLRRTDLKYTVNGVDRSGWLFQKFLKYAGATLSDKSHVLVIDSDTVLVRPQVFEVGGKLVLLHADEHHEIYFQVCESLLGYPRVTELSCVSHMALYDLARLGALKAHIEKRFQCPWFEAIIRNTRMDDASGCSDYELYGQWCLSQYPLETTCEYFFNTHCGREGLRPVAELERHYGTSYRSLSFHSYVPREYVTPLPSPLVSIFLPAYNREKYLPATLDSLLAQRFENFEIIIADDGSADGTLELARGYAERDARVKVLALDHRGEVAARNEAVAHAAPGAKYLMNHDSDDISLPDKLLKLVTFLESHPEIAIVGCFADYFDDEGRPLGSPPIEHEPARIRATFGQTNSMINSTALIRREVFEKIGGFREEFRRAEDYDFFARALLAGFELANVPEVLHRIRRHPSSVGSIHSQYVQELADAIRADYREGRIPVIPRLSAPAAPSMPNSKPGKEPLSILHTVEFYPPHTGGAEFVVQQISERLARRGHCVTVATSHLDDRNFQELNGVTVFGFAVQGKLAEGITGEATRYQKFLREHDADVMMNYAAQQWATDLAFDVVAETRGRRVNIIAPCGYSALTDYRTLRWPSFRDYFEYRLPEVLPLYDAAVYHSGIYQDFEYGRALNLQNGVIIPNGTDEEEFTRPVTVSFREKYNITTRFVGLCVANFYADKGQDQVIECVRQMNRPDFTMVFIGKEGGQCAALRQQASGLDIRFLVDIPREDTVAAFRSADLFLFASRIEASPLVIIEAKAAGLPFVSTDCGNVREWQGGIVCAPDKMVAEANRLLNDDSVRKRLGHAGQQEWKEKLTWEAVTDQWEEFYLRLHRERQRCAKTGAASPQDVLVEHQRVFCQMHPLQTLPDPKKQCSRLMKENAKLLKKCRLLEKQVESATRWQSRSWFKRAFHKWRPAKASPGKIEKRESKSQGDGKEWHLVKAIFR